MVAKKSGVKRPAWPGGGGKDRFGGAGPGKAVKRVSGSKKTGSAGKGPKGVSPLRRIPRRPVSTGGQGRPGK